MRKSRIASRARKLLSFFMPWKWRKGRRAQEEDGGLYLAPHEVHNLLALCAHAKWMSHRWQSELGPALSTLGSRHANECHEHILTAAEIAHSMQRKAGVLPPAA